MKLEKYEWLAKMLARLSLGSVFLLSGWGKLHSLDNVTEFFTGLGIPFPLLNAYFISGLEFVGGIAIILGFGFRFFSALLTATMVVAIATAKRADIQSVTDLLGFEEFVYICVFLWFVTTGAGRLSIDCLIKSTFPVAPHK